MEVDRSLGSVRWIGGGSGAGKSTIARRLESEYGCVRYATDGSMADHAARLDSGLAPRLYEFLAMSMDERWLDRSPIEMFDSFHWFAGEGFDLVADDLRQTTDEKVIVAEGFRLLPGLVAPFLIDPRDAVWLLPTPEFRRMAFEQRGGLWAIAGQTSDPNRALDNLLERDRLFTEWLRSEVERLGLFSVCVGIGDDEEEIFDAVADLLFAAGGAR